MKRSDVIARCELEKDGKRFLIVVERPKRTPHSPAAAHLVSASQ